MTDRTRKQIMQPSDLKIEVIITDLPDGHTMDDIDFSVKFSTPGSSVSKDKASLVRIETEAGIGRYIACFRSTEVGKGDILMTVSASIPDDAFAGGLRNDVVTVDTKVTVI